jgi:hypothetical protein
MLNGGSRRDRVTISVSLGIVAWVLLRAPNDFNKTGWMGGHRNDQTGADVRLELAVALGWVTRVSASLSARLRYAETLAQ